MCVHFYAVVVGCEGEKMVGLGGEVGDGGGVGKGCGGADCGGIGGGEQQWSLWLISGGLCYRWWH